MNTSIKIAESFRDPRRGVKAIHNLGGFFYFHPMFYIYFLYSKSGDTYYVGSTENYHQRLEEHNSGDRITWTSKYRPWIMAAVFECGESRGEAIKIEKFIKKQKSRKFTEKTTLKFIAP